MPLSTLAAIIERDSKATTYKFALLRATIDAAVENSPHTQIIGDRVYLPVGLLVEKWMLYYFPIVEAGLAHAQINGRGKLAFLNELQVIVNHYTRFENGYSSFYHDLRVKGIPDVLTADFIALVKKMRHTIVNMPMRYIGKSVNQTEYSIYRPEPGVRFLSADRLDGHWLANACGTFSIPLDYFETFQLLGSFVGGQSSILMKWAEFSVAASDRQVEDIMQHVLRTPVTDRDVAASKKVYQEVLQTAGSVTCVYSGKPLRSYDIDHVIPFSVWKNNDLWNLLPASKTVNSRKRDKIPTPELLEQRSAAILHYWHLLNERAHERFNRELSSALLGAKPARDWDRDALSRLQNHCAYLIDQRGCLPFAG